MTTNNNDLTEESTTSENSLSINRRALLQTVGLGSAIGLAGCVGKGIETIGQSNDEHVPFDVWEEVRTAIRTSPDHLPARADQVVSEGDPEAIFQFVRDEIATYPPEIDGLYGTTEAMRWGIRGTLRGGAGTPREKAELLASLYRQAGFTAEVLISSRLVEDREQEKAAVQDLLWQPAERQFAPDIDDEQLAEWNDRLGVPSEAQPDLTSIDANGRESHELGQTLFEQLPDERRAPQAFDWRWKGTPVVRVVVDDEERYANLFTPGIQFGEAGIPADHLQEAPEASESLPVEATLSAVTAPAPNEPFDLVSGVWSLDELVGRQLLVQTLPGIDPLERPDVTFREIQTFIPALTVQGIDLDEESMTALSKRGDAVTRAGDRLQVGRDGTIVRNGEPLVEPDAVAAAADVAELNVTADSGRYPEVRLNIHAQDANGELVEGLPATAFEVTDEDQPVGVALTANKRTPRVFILSDTSSSMPSNYRGEGMTELVERLRERILRTEPNVDISHWETSSEIWTYLNRAASSDANLVVYATDGHVNDQLTPEIETALRQGPPAVMLSVNEDQDETLQQMADLTGGTLEPAGNHTAAEEAIMTFLAEQIPTLPNYVLTYGAPSDTPGDHRVTVRIVDQSSETTDPESSENAPEGTDTYTVPPSPALAPHLAGLYLMISVGDREVTRTLAGYDPVRHSDQPITQTMIDEAAGALFGSHTLSIEAAAPPFSVWFDDLLGAKLSVAGLDRALQIDDQEALKREREQGFMVIPPDLFALAAPLPDEITDQSLTYQNGPRMTLYEERPVFGTDHIVRHVDLLPFTEFTTAAADPEQAFRSTLEKTARLAVIEGALFDTSTYSLLDDLELNEIGAIDDEAWDRDRERLWDQLIDPYDGRDYQLVPASGTFPSRFAAFWNVNYETGEVVGILGDGSGGGSKAEGIREQIEQIDKAISLYNLWLVGAASAGLLTPWGAFAIGVVAAYGQTLARLYGAAALAITIMDTSQLDEQTQAAIAYLACNVARSIAFALIDEWVVDAIDNILGVAGASNPTSCPE